MSGSEEKERKSMGKLDGYRGGVDCRERKRLKVLREVAVNGGLGCNKDRLTVLVSRQYTWKLSGL